MSQPLAAMQIKFAALKDHAKALETTVAKLKEAPFDPAIIPGLVKAKELELKKRKRASTSTWRSSRGARARCATSMRPTR